MKKTIYTAAALILPFLAGAQNIDDRGLNREVFNAIAIIFVLGLFMVFIISMIKLFLNNRLKSKILDKGVPESIISQLMEQKPKNDNHANVKWFAILTGLGTALTAIYYTQPLGIHSLAIMSFCIAAAFLGYFFFEKYSEKKG